MLRTQISLSEHDRQLLDEAAARTGRSIAALIREAVHVVYGYERTAEEDLSAMRAAIGAWEDRDLDGAAYVDHLRSGRRIGQ
jgi:hypothetical protein